MPTFLGALYIRGDPSVGKGTGRVYLLTDEQINVIHTTGYHSDFKRENSAIFKNMDDHQGYYAKYNTPETENSA